MKLCKDCKWSSGKDNFLECKAPKNMTSSEVTGEPKPRLIYCETQRMGPCIIAFIPPMTCGRQGRWFESKGEK